jgi:uncharacterized repeat protein (TIGR01451 family)
MRILLLFLSAFIYCNLSAQWTNIPLPNDHLAYYIVSTKSKHIALKGDFFDYTFFESTDAIHWNAVPKNKYPIPVKLNYPQYSIFTKGDSIGIISENTSSTGPRYKITWSFDAGASWPVKFDLPTAALKNVQFISNRLLLYDGVVDYYSDRLGDSLKHLPTQTIYYNEILPFKNQLWFSDLDKLYLSRDTALTWKQMPIPGQSQTNVNFWIFSAGDRLVGKLFDHSLQSTSYYELFNDTTWIKNANYPNDRYGTVYEFENHLYLSVLGKTLRSSNNGMTWDSIGTASTKLGERLLVTSQDAQVSLDGGDSWQYGFYGTQSQLTPIYASKDKLYLESSAWQRYIGAFSGSSVHLSPFTWQAPATLGVVKDGNVAAVCKDDTLFYSIDDGLTFNKRGIGFEGRVTCISGNLIIINHTNTQAIYATTDFGLNVTLLPDQDAKWVQKTSKNLFWLDVTNGFLYSSTLSDPLNLQLMQGIPLYLSGMRSMGEHLFISTYQVFGGPPAATYRVNGSNDLTLSNLNLHNIFSHTAHENELYYTGTGFSTIMKSIDGGINWEPDPFPFPNAMERSVRETEDYFYVHCKDNNGNYLFSKPKKSATHLNATGNVFFDENKNGIKESTEKGFTKVIVNTKISGTYSSVNGNGNFQIPFLESIRDTLQASPTHPLYYITTPDIPVDSNARQDKLIGVGILPNISDLGVSITHNQPFRPGFPSSIIVTIENFGSQAAEGEAKITIPAGVNVLNITATPFSTVGSAYTFKIPSLQLGETFKITFYIKTDVSTPLNTEMLSIAQLLNVQSDIDSLNDMASDLALAMGSFDPNDKQVSRQILSPTEIQAKTPIIYTIRFQNTGTLAAIDVRVVDTLSASIEVGSLRVIDASHSYTMTIRERGILEFSFLGINLPDSTTNEQLSHGFIRFTVQFDSTLSLGQKVENTAAIYFDFNAPIITNTTVTEVKIVHTTQPLLPEVKFWVAPNPVQNHFSIKLNEPITREADVIISDVAGKVVYRKRYSSVQDLLEFRDMHLASGVYFIRLMTESGSGVQKFIVERG